MDRVVDVNGLRLDSGSDEEETEFTQEMKEQESLEILHRLVLSLISHGYDRQYISQRLSYNPPDILDPILDQHFGNHAQ